MDGPTAKQVERAARFLASAVDDTGGRDAAAAPERAYEKLHLRLALLIGSAGVRALFLRSLKLTARQHPALDEAVAGGEGSDNPASRVRHCCRQLKAAETKTITEAVFARFFALMDTFIGEKLTEQVIRSAWAELGSPRPEEKKK